MKNNTLRRAVTLLTMLAMMLTLFSGVVAFAAEDDAIISTDPNKKGSITVHKYDSQAPSVPATGNATGMSNDSANVNDGYRALEGAEFRLYPVGDAEMVRNYYRGTDNVATPYTVNSVTVEGSPEYPDTFKVKDLNGQYVNTYKKSDPQYTDTNGEAKFTNLDIGFYYLVEVKHSDMVTAPLAAPALISIPMVNTMFSNGTSGSSNNSNAKWMYEVNVYPKNHTAEADITLNKKTETGESLKSTEVTFTLERNVGKLDSSNQVEYPDNNWETYTEVTNEAGTPTTLPVNTDANGVLKLENLPAGLHGTKYRLTEISAPAGYIINVEPIEFTVNADNTITFDDTPANKQVIKKSYSPGSATQNAKLELDLTNIKPDIIKTVQENKTNPDYANWAQYSIGDIINYKLEVEIPANIAELATFTIRDTCDYLTSWSDPVVKVVNGDSKVDVTLEKSVVYSGTDIIGFEYLLGQTAATTDNNDKIVEKNAAGKKLEITYSAVLDSNAIVNDKGNTNPATLTYSKSTDATNAETYSIIDKAVVYTYKYTITKYKDSAVANNEAEGVQFELYESNGTTRVPMTNVTEGNDGNYRHTANTTEAGTEGKGVTLKTGADGKLVLQGLEPGTYKLKETKTLDGYNLLSDFVTINVMFNGTDYTVEDDIKISSPSFSGNTLTKENDGQQTNWTDAAHEQNIINKKGFVLPQTGSMGYLLFCAAGLILIGGGAALMFSGRKKVIR